MTSAAIPTLPADVSLVESLLNTIDALSSSLKQEQEVNAGLHADQLRLDEALRTIKMTERTTYDLYVQECLRNKELDEKLASMTDSLETANELNDKLQLEKVEMKREMVPRDEEQVKQLQIELLRATTEAGHLRTNLKDAEQKTLLAETNFLSYKAAHEQLSTAYGIVAHKLATIRNTCNK